MHQDILSRDIIYFTNTMRLHFCISDGERQVFHGEMIIVIRVFSSLFYHSQTKLLFSVDKKTLRHTMTPCFKAVLNMEDIHPSNLNKFQLCVKLLLNLHQLAWTKLLCVKLSWFRIFIFQLPNLVCNRK